MKMIRQSILGVLMAMLIPASGQAAGIVSTVVSATDDIVVSSNAEATVTSTGRDDLVSGSYPINFVLANWTASVTSGTIAYRINPVIHSGSSEGRFGDTKNTSDASKLVSLAIGFTGGTGTSTLINGWRVLPQGTSSITQGIVVVNNRVQTLTPGTYPVGIDVAAYAY